MLGHSVYRSSNLQQLVLSDSCIRAESFVYVPQKWGARRWRIRQVSRDAAGLERVQLSQHLAKAVGWHFQMPRDITLKKRRKAKSVHEDVEVSFPQSRPGPQS